MNNSTYEVLSQWNTLLKNGTITDNEYEIIKNSLLDNNEKKSYGKGKLNYNEDRIGYAALIVIAIIIWLLFPSDFRGNKESSQESTVIANDSTINNQEPITSPNENFEEQEMWTNEYYINASEDNPVYVYEGPDINTRLDEGFTTKEYIVTEFRKGDFLQVSFKNSNGEVTKRWLRIEDLISKN